MLIPLIGLLTGCKNATEDTGPTWYGDIQPLMQRSCQGCHQDDSIAPFPLSTYEEVSVMGAVVADSVSSGAMPPWGVESTESCEPRHGFVNDLRLSDDEIAMIEAWVEAGTPEGDPADAVTADVSTTELSRVDVEVMPASAYAVSGTEDEFICFPLDPGFETDVYLQGTHVLAGNDLVAHHMLLFSDPNRESLELAGEQGWYPCFGDADVSDTALLAAWAPGGLPTELPDNAGMPVSAGTMLVMQMHYHPTGTTTEEDQTRVQLKTTTEEPEWHSLVALIGNFTDTDEQAGLVADDSGDMEFRIPAGSASHTEEMFYINGADFFDGGPNPEHHILGVAPHMHYLGTQMRAWVERYPADEGLCPASEMGDFHECFMEHCPDVSSEGAGLCAKLFCAEEASGVDTLCESCLSAQLSVTDPTDAFDVCMNPAEYSTPDQPDEECFFESPSYDFEWQRLYTYDAEINDLPIVRPGDALRFTCTYDNSMDNDTLVDALDSQGLESPVDVYIGDTTLDEMCLLVLQTLYRPY
jgi:hypothetical protein